MSAFTMLRRFIVRDLLRSGSAAVPRPTITIGVLFPAVPAMLFNRPYDLGAVVAISVGIALGLAWYALVAWRGLRLLRATAARTDRKYDRQGKFGLPPEYSDTESVTKAARRKREKRAKPN